MLCFKKILKHTMLHCQRGILLLNIPNHLGWDSSNHTMNQHKTVQAKKQDVSGFLFEYTTPKEIDGKK